MTTESVARSRSSNALPRSRGTKRPSYARTIRPPNIRGRRESRVLGAPAAPRAKCRKHASASPQVRRNTRPSLRNGFNGLLRALPGDRACLPPSPPRSFASRELDASVGASGPHDFAVRKHAPSSEAPPASIASRPASVTIANRPSIGTRRCETCR